MADDERAPGMPRNAQPATWMDRKVSSRTDSQIEQYLTLAAAAKRCPGRPSANTIWRWCRRGVKARSGERVHLEHVRIGGRVFTTTTALTNFGQRLAKADRAHFQEETASPKTPNPVNRSAKQQQQVIEAAEKLLTDAGC